MTARPWLILMALSALAGCQPDDSVQLPGATEWDRIEILAEASERVVAWHVVEGQLVAAGEQLLSLESTRLDARIEAARARLMEAEAQLAELVSGPRKETIDRARAELDSALAARAEAELEYERVSTLLERGLTSDSSVDQARAARDQRRAAVNASTAALDELLAGSRAEQIDQGRARAAALRAEVEELSVTRERLDVRAPRPGRVDSLPFKPGDQPRMGDTVASLLVGETPIARIFIPASVRARFTEGDSFEIRVEGVESTFEAHIRSIRSEASFTPYYALTGDDASRLVYRAELLLDQASAADLPAGLPLTATPLQVATPNGTSE